VRDLRALGFLKDTFYAGMPSEVWRSIDGVTWNVVAYNPFNNVATKSRNHAAAINQNAWTVTNPMTTNLEAILMTAKINDKNQMIFFGALSLIRTSDFLSNCK
jgi:hypothetical protein